MHPPFFTVDHKVGPDICHHGDTRPIVRRNLPARLTLAPAVPGWPPVPALPAILQDCAVVQVPGGAPVRLRPQLQIVPPPRRGMRDRIGRWLIRAGQRMILENRLG